MRLRSRRSSKALPRSKSSKLRPGFSTGLHVWAERGILIFGDIASAYACEKRHPDIWRGKSSRFRRLELDSEGFPVHPALQVREPVAISVKRRTDNVQQANGSKLRGTASPEGWRAISSITANLVRTTFFALPGAFVPAGAFAVSCRRNSHFKHLRRVYSSFARLREVKSLGVFSEIPSGVNA
jgi:hypothetical protein